MGLAPKMALLSAGLLVGYVWYRRATQASSNRGLRQIESAPSGLSSANGPPEYGEIVSDTVYELSKSGSVTVADVVLVHGISGSHVYDFCEPSSRHSPEAFMQESWLQALLPAAVKKPVRVISLKVDFAALLSPSTTRPVLDEVAAHLLHCLSLVGVGTGHRPLVFICRDFAGIVVKALISHAQIHSAYKTVYCNIAGVRVQWAQVIGQP